MCRLCVASVEGTGCIPVLPVRAARNQAGGAVMTQQSFLGVLIVIRGDLYTVISADVLLSVLI